MSNVFTKNDLSVKFKSVETKTEAFKKTNAASVNYGTINFQNLL